MRIIKLEAENIKRLVAVNITPDGAVIEVAGKNSQGKTSLLDSIWYALGGKPGNSQPVRKGQDSASVTITTEDYVITRKFTAKGTTSLVVETESPGGKVARISSPQALLDELIGDLTFDPLAFSRESPKKQAAIIQRVCGLDFSAMDAERKSAFDDRTEHNREVKSLSIQLDALPAMAQPVPKRVSVADLSGALDAANASVQKDDSMQRGIAAIDRQLELDADNVDRLKSQLSGAESKVHEGNASRDSAIAAWESYEAVDPEPIKQQLRDAEETNRLAANHETRVETAKLSVAQRVEADECTAAIDAIDAKKSQMIADADIGIPGLSFTADGPTIEGIEFAECSTTEQLKTSFAILIAGAKELRIALIRDGSLLDTDGMAAIAEIAEKHDIQVWIERVSDDGAGCSVVIEDGSIKAPPETLATQIEKAVKS